MSEHEETTNKPITQTKQEYGGNDFRYKLVEWDQCLKLDRKHFSKVVEMNIDNTGGFNEMK